MDKYPDSFHITLDVVVSAADRPRVDQASVPWEGFTAKGLGSKIVFSNKKEQQQLAAEFGRFYFILVHLIVGVSVCACRYMCAGVLMVEVCAYMQILCAHYIYNAYNTIIKQCSLSACIVMCIGLM